MEKFQLSVLFKIIGISSASGLLYHNDLLYVISDNSNYLYEYNIADEKLNKIALVENPQENIVKKDKPDFEAITNLNESVLILGSGSTYNRNKVIFYNTISTQKKVRNFSGIYHQMKFQLQLNDDELNIEGFIATEKTFYFFQRGNGSLGKNGIVSADQNTKEPNFKFVPFNLPKINNVPATFTDAVLVDDKIYFLASAENTTSTYLDGEVLGSIIGTIDLKTLKLEDYLQISDKHKFEGLTLYKKSANQIEFLLCEDTDSETMESNIYKIVLNKNR
jgi:hypothetical protein